MRISAGIPIPVYMDLDGEYRWSMRQASMTVGFNQGWLSDTLRTEGNALNTLKGLWLQRRYR